MDYDVQLVHKPGKTMIPADALSRRHDHSIGIDIKEDIIVLPENLFVNLIDLDLQDAVVAGQKEDSTTKSALEHLKGAPGSINNTVGRNFFFRVSEGTTLGT